MSQPDIIPFADQPKGTGQICYEAFAQSLGWQFRGRPLPRWAELYQGEQDAFTAGAHEVIQKGWKQAQEGSGGTHRRRVAD